MIVVSNASPLQYLVLIDAVHVLEQLFGEVLRPPAVETELTRPRTPAAVVDWLQASPKWLKVQAPTISDPSLEVHAGEAEAILLAKELEADRLLIDDRKAMRAAQERGIRTTRTTAVLALAAERGMVDLRAAFERLRLTNFRAPPELLGELLRRFWARGE